MQSVNVGLIALVLGSVAIWVARPALAQATAPAGVRLLKVAIISRDAAGPKTEEAMAVLSASLSGSTFFSLVERQQVRKVLAEQTLQTLSDTSASVKLGQLVGADLLVFCEVLKNSKLPVMRAEIVETASGVILQDQLQELQSLTNKPEDFRQVVEAAVKKAGVPAPDRKLIGLIGISSEEPGKSLDPLTTSLDVLLRTDLAQAPSVVVLEREQLRHLTAERGLSGMDVKLRASTRLLEIKVKRAAGEQSKDHLDFAVRITEMTGGKAQTLQLSLPAHDLVALRGEMIARILKALDTPLPPSAAGNIPAEAKAFHERSTRLLLNGYVKEALPLAVTAFTLDPQPEYHKNLARVCSDIFDDIKPSLGNTMTIMGPRARTAEQLGAMLLLAEINLDEAHRLGATLPMDLKDPGKPEPGPVGAPLHDLQFMFPLPDPAQTEEQKVILEILDRTREEHEVWLDIYRQRHWPTQQLEINYLASCPFRIHSAAEFCKLYQDAYEEFERADVLAAKDPSLDRPPCPDVCMLFYGLAWSGYLGNIKLQDTRPLLMWLTQRKDPLLRAQGWNALASFPGDEADDAAIKVLDIVFREKAFARLKPGWTFPVDILEANNRIRNSPKKDVYAKALLDDLEKAHDPLPVLRFLYESNVLFNTVDPANALATLQRVQKLVASAPVPQPYARNLRLYQMQLAQSIAHLQKQQGDVAKKSNPWDAFSIRDIKYDAAPEGASKLIWAQVDRTRKTPDLLLLWRSDPIDEKVNQAQFNLVVTRMAMEGGKLTEVARGKLPGPAYRTYGQIFGFRITSVLPTPDGIFISDFRRGLIVVRDGKFTTWTEKDGLTSNQIWSLAWSHDTLYAGADNGFMTVDPHTGKCKTLGSANALTSLNPLDGGTPYRVTNILPSPDAKSLWLSIGSDQSRLGLWRYDLASGTYEHVVHVPDKATNVHDTGPSITWHEGKLLVVGVNTGLYDANSGDLIKSFRGQGMYDVIDTDVFPDERSTDKVWEPIAYTPSNRMALSSIGFITRYGVAVEPAGAVASLWKSRLVKPEMERNWYVLEEVGNGFFAAAYWDSIDRPRLWYISPPNSRAASVGAAK